jgi:hypothetical protein
VHVETLLAEKDMLALINHERTACGVLPLREHTPVRYAYSPELRDWLCRDDPNDLYDAPDAAEERAQAVRALGVEVVHDRLACFDLDLGDMLDPDVEVPWELSEAMVRSLLEGPSFAGPLRDPAATHVGLVMVHQSIATEPVSWKTWVGALLVRPSVDDDG